MEQDLVNTRKGVKKQRAQAEKEYGEDSIQYQVLDARQLALKIACNSAYGVLGLQGSRGRLSLVEGAAAVTYCGRTTIMKANKWLADTYNGKFVYGDTDSSMISIPGVTGMDMMDKGIEVTRELNKQFPDLVNFEFEKAMDRMIIVSKKRYMSHMIIKDGKPADEILRRGIYSVRSDGCNWMRKVADRVMKYGLDLAPPLLVIEFLYDEFRKLMNDEIDLEDLVLCTTIRDYDSSSNHTNALFKRRMMQRGVSIKNGTKVHYVYCNADQSKIGSKMEEINYYMNTLREGNSIEERQTILHIDRQTYLDKVCKMVDNLFPIAFRNDIEHYHGATWFESHTGYSYTINNLGKLLNNLFKKNDNLESTINLILADLADNYMSGKASYVPQGSIPSMKRTNKDTRPQYDKAFESDLKRLVNVGLT